jgi:hypothetical protein
VTYPCRLNAGLCSRTSVADEADAADLKVVWILMQRLQCNDSGLAKVTPLSTRTHTVGDHDSRIFDPAEIAELNRFGSDLEFQ